MSSFVEGTVAILVVLGALFVLLGSLGLARFPDFYTRLHGPGKATTLGIGSLLAGSLLYFGARGQLSGHEVLITLFVVLTTPVGTHLLARAARHRGVKVVGTGVERLPARTVQFEEPGHFAPGGERTGGSMHEDPEWISGPRPGEPADDEQTARRRQRKGGSAGETEPEERELDENLKDTFPASDPVPPKHVD